MAAAISTPSKTQGATLLALQAGSANAQIIGSELDVSGKLAGLAFIHFGRTNSVTSVGRGVILRIEAADKSSGGNHWYPLWSVETGVQVINSQNNVSSSGAALTLAGSLGFSASDVIVIADGTLASTEWARIKSMSGAVATMEETLGFSHSTGTSYTGAQMFAAPLDLRGIGRLRLVADGMNHGVTFLIEAYLNTLDSVGTV